MCNLYNKLLEQGYPDLTITNKVLMLLSKLGYDPIYGARLLNRVIQQYIENPLSQKILSGKLLLRKK